MDRNQHIQNRIIADLSEGVMVIRFDGVIEFVNDAALTILHKKAETLVGLTFARAFFTDVNNDVFIQCMMDAVYEKAGSIECYAPYNTGNRSGSCASSPPIWGKGMTSSGLFLF